MSCLYLYLNVLLTCVVLTLTDHSQANPVCTLSSSQQHYSKSHPLSSTQGYSNKWEKEFTWSECIGDQGASCKIYEILERNGGILLERSGGAWMTKSFNNWKKALKKMWVQSVSGSHPVMCY